MKRRTHKIHTGTRTPDRSLESYRRAVANKAYELYLKRGATPGSEDVDWRDAERIVSARSQ